MEFGLWERYYKEILDDFGFSREDDEYSAKVLDEILSEEGCLTLDDLGQIVNFSDKYIVFGHTPTCYFWAEEKGVSLEEILREENCNHIFRKGKLIGIDCGCAYDGYLGCLCLETMEEIYV